MSNFSFLVYRSSDEDVSVNAIVKDESVWLSQKAMAELFGVSKSTVHKDLTERLENIDSSLAIEVRKILDLNKSERHIRGGMATKE